MKNVSRAAGFLGLLTILVLSISSIAQADTVEGVVQGFTCALHGKACPMDRKARHATAEHIFVIVDSDGRYHFVPNLTRKFLAGNILQRVRVTGELKPRYRAVNAEKFEILNQGKWEHVWSGTPGNRGFHPVGN